MDTVDLGSAGADAYQQQLQYLTFTARKFPVLPATGNG